MVTTRTFFTVIISTCVLIVTIDRSVNTSSLGITSIIGTFVVIITGSLLELTTIRFYARIKSTEIIVSTLDFSGDTSNFRVAITVVASAWFTINFNSYDS